MTINLDNTKITLDFEYEEGDVNYKIKFHNTEALGDTISISDNGSDYFSYPALMFIDIGDFLKEQKVIKKTKTSDVSSPKKPQPKIGDLISTVKGDEEVSSFGGLAVPSIEGETDILSQPVQEDEQEQININNSIINKYSQNVEELPEPEVQEDNGEKPLSEDDVEKQWLLRERIVKNKVENPEKAVKRRS